MATAGGAGVLAIVLCAIGLVLPGAAGADASVSMTFDDGELNVHFVGVAQSESVTVVSGDGPGSCYDIVTCAENPSGGYCGSDASCVSIMDGGEVGHPLDVGDGCETAETSVGPGAPIGTDTDVANAAICDYIGDTPVNIGVNLGPGDDALTIGGKTRVHTASIGGQAGNDTLNRGIAEHVSVFGGPGKDTINGALVGESGTYPFAGAPDDLHGGAGRDTIISRNCDPSSTASGTLTGLADGGPGSDLLTIAPPRFSTVSCTANLGKHARAIERVTGTDIPDVIVGGRRAERITAGLGHDRIDGRGGNDTIDAGDGDDTVSGGPGNDIIEGGPCTTTYNSDGSTRCLPSVDVLSGGAGNDRIHTESGTLRGGTGNDRLDCGDGCTLDDGPGNDVALGGKNLSPIGIDLDGTVFYSGPDHFIAGPGDDTYDGRAGRPAGPGTTPGTYPDVFDDTIDATSVDTIDYRRASGPVTLSPGADGVNGGTAGEHDRIVHIPAVIGSRFADVLHAPDHATTMFGGPGKDTITGGAGTDLLAGGEGYDRLSGGSGPDVLKGEAGNDALAGDTGDDTLEGGTGADAFAGGADTDVADYTKDGHTTGVLITLDVKANDGNGTDRRTARAAADPVPGPTTLPIIGGADNVGDDVEIVIGGPAGDTITGNDGDNRLIGGFGSDSVSGGGGNDTLGAGLYSTAFERVDDAEGAVNTLNGGPGDDTLRGGAFGPNTLTGSDGNDTLVGGDRDDHLDGGAGDDRIAGHQGNDTADGGDGNDLITNIDPFPGSDTMNGGAGDDQINGGELADTIDGGAGNDIVNGNPGDDTLAGGDDNDEITGGDGNDGVSGGNGDDKMVGGLGDDTLTGGLGVDIFFCGEGEGDRAVDRTPDEQIGFCEIHARPARDARRG